MESLQVKQCCANLYGSEAARFLLGMSFHPGGVELTGRLAQLARLSDKSVVLDVAAGKGTSALFMAESIGCRVIGIDLSPTNVEQASTEAMARGLNDQATFILGDAEQLPFEAATFDAIVCECAFCTFPDKQRAANEFERVLRPAGLVAISDLTRTRTPLPELEGLLAWIACIGDAQPLEQYAAWLSDAGFRIDVIEQHDRYLAEMVKGIRSKLLAADVLKGLGKLDIPGLDTEQAKKFAHAAARAVQSGQLGYGVVVARKNSAL